MNVALIPPNKEHLQNKIFKSEFHRDFGNLFFQELKMEFILNGHNFQTYDLFHENEKIDALLFYRLDFEVESVVRLRKKNPQVKIFYFAVEPPLICYLHKRKLLLANWRFSKVFSWNQDLCNLNGYKEFPYTMDIPFNYYTDYNNRNDKIVAVFSYKRKMERNNGYDLRMRLIKELCIEGLVDLYGVGWDNCPDEIILSCYKGSIENKAQILEKYKYCLAIENSGLRNYVTEKLLDAISLGCIPIYWGASNIIEIINPNLFISINYCDTLSDIMGKIEKFNESEYLKSRDEFSKTGITKWLPKNNAKRVYEEVISTNSEEKPYSLIKVIIISILSLNPWKSRKYLFDLFMSIIR